MRFSIFEIKEDLVLRIIYSLSISFIPKRYIVELEVAQLLTMRQIIRNQTYNNGIMQIVLWLGMLSGAQLCFVIFNDDLYLTAVFGSVGVFAIIRDA